MKRVIAFVFAVSLLFGQTADLANKTIGAVPIATNPMTTLGDTIYGGAGGNVVRLPGNTNTTPKVWTQTGDGVNSAPPGWQVVPSSGTLTYYLHSTDSLLTNPSAIVTTDKQALTPPQVSKTAVDIAHNAAADVVLQTWATDPGFPGLTFIPAGQYLLHVHAYRLSGNRAVTLYAVFREVTAAGVAVGTIGTLTESTPTLTTGELEYTIAMAVGTPYTMALSSSRLVLDLHAVLTGGSNNTTVRTYVGGTADTYMALPSSTVDATNFVPYNGATQDVNLGTHNLTIGTTVLGPKTIGAGASQLPAAASCSGCITIVTDAANASDCTVGSGSSIALCRSTGSAWAMLGGVPANNRIGTFGCTFATVTTGTVCYVPVSYSCTVTDWTVWAVGTTPTVSMDVWRTAAAVTAALPTVAQEIAGTGHPTLTAANRASAAVANWTSTTITAGDMIAFSITNDVATSAGVSINCTK